MEGGGGRSWGQGQITVKVLQFMVILAPGSIKVKG